MPHAAAARLAPTLFGLLAFVGLLHTRWRLAGHETEIERLSQKVAAMEVVRRQAVTGGTRALHGSPGGESASLAASDDLGSLMIGERGVTGGGPTIFATGAATTTGRARPAAAAAVLGGVPSRNVFIDLGANCGNSYLKMLRKKLIGGTDLEAFLWEANPQLVHFYLNDLKARDDRVRIVKHAAWVEDKPMQFFIHAGQENVTSKEQFKAHKCNPRSNYQPAGASSLFSGKGDGGDFDRGRKARLYRPGKPVEVQALDFNVWLAGLGLRAHDRVVLKIDIEGAEIPLLQHLLGKGGELACVIDYYLIEWHSWLLSDAAGVKAAKQFEDAFVNETIPAKCGVAPAWMQWH